MNNHTIAIEKVSADYLAECSCGWVSNRAWLEATVRRVAENHVSAAIVPSTA